MENKWLRLALISFIGIVISELILRLPGSFGSSGAMNPTVLTGIPPSGMNISGIMYGMTASGMPSGTDINMYSPMVQTDLNIIQQQLTDIKNFIGIGMPAAISIGVINFWRSYINK